MELTLAIVSDLHCHHSSSWPAETYLLSDGDRKPAKNHPVESFCELAKKESFKVDALLMPGDIAHKVDKQGLISGWDFVRQMGSAVGAPLLIPTLGNHDVVSRKPSDDAFGIARSLSPCFPCEEGAEYDQFWAHGYCVFETKEARFLTVNSVRSHTNEESAERGLILPQQLASLDTALSKFSAKTFNVAICHHHPILHEDINLGTKDVMQNGGELLTLLAKHNFDLVVHGHKHHPKLTCLSTPGTVAVFAAGSFSAGMSGGLATRTRNVFHLISLRRASKSDSVFGTIKTWQFQIAKGWTPASVDAVDFPFVTGFGCVEGGAALAAKVLAQFRLKNQDYCQWSEIRRHLPELDYVPPTTFAQMAGVIADSGVNLTPRPPDQPQFIGVPT
jgi:hypothetical protein